MRLFKKKENVVKKGVAPVLNEPPKLPALPRLPDLPEIGSGKSQKKPIYKLPSYPSNSLGEKFSQNTIKDAVSGEKEMEDFEEDDFVRREEARRIPKPPRRTLRGGFGEISRETRRTEPVFIRIDRFEESLRIFEDAKRQLSSIEDMLGDIEKIRGDEDVELEHWEKEIQTLKGQIEKIDRDVFSRIE